MKYKRKNQFNQKKIIDDEKFYAPKNFNDLIYEFKIDLTSEESEIS